MAEPKRETADDMVQRFEERQRLRAEKAKREAELEVERPTPATLLNDRGRRFLAARIDPPGYL